MEMGRPSLFQSSLALAREIEQAWADASVSHYYEYPWEHLGDAERDVKRLIEGLNAVAPLVEIATERERREHGPDCRCKLATALEQA